jgi:hypothetical protein
MFQVFQSRNTYNQSYILHTPLSSRCLDGLLFPLGKPAIISCDIDPFGIIDLILSCHVLRGYANGSSPSRFYYFLIERVDECVYRYLDVLQYVQNTFVHVLWIRSRKRILILGIQQPPFLLIIDLLLLLHFRSGCEIFF